MRPGSGREPITLSTAILSGSGVSSASGLESRLKKNRTAMSGQDGRASRRSRRKTRTSLYVAIVLAAFPRRRAERPRNGANRPRALEHHAEREYGGHRDEDRRGRPGVG